MALIAFQRERFIHNLCPYLIKATQQSQSQMKAKLFYILMLDYMLLRTSCKLKISSFFWNTALKGMRLEQSERIARGTCKITVLLSGRSDARDPIVPPL